MTARRRPLLGLLAGHGVSLTGSMVTFVALPLHVLDTTDSAARTGLVAAVATAPVVLAGAFGGPLVDRAGHRAASVAADVAGAATIATVPLLHAAGRLPLAALLGLVFLAGLLDTLGRTARSALLPEMAQRSGAGLARAAGLFEATERGARLVGAPLAGLVVAAAHEALPVLWVHAAGCLAAAIVVTAHVPPPGRAPPVDPAGYWTGLRAGIRYLRREPLLRALVTLVLGANFLDAAYALVLLPVVAVDRLPGGALALGLLTGAMGGGALAGSLVYGAIGHRLPRRATFVAAYALAGGPPLYALAAGLPMPLLVGVTAVAALAAGFIMPIIATLRLERVPPDLRARVYGVSNAAFWAAIPLGAVVAGLAVGGVGDTAALVAVGTAYFLVALVPLAGGPFRGMDPADGRGPEVASIR
ncbi:MFS transporter [Spirilliplanes yamanashiensis]|uniref:Major facilitator superfamily (MFS) profile domain-containing protein n=1 Tax=Spirilliplanes yamanashiensis TaxID=42233 RepID=A0A8J3YBD8_9ACTN|nr:MFS transporter [Spirilliplanes yamanashiensis]MDP9817968.1 MFS family permease [Spirilliplanes yamanashiensis]GIJ04777.1 hypothetical protein Sya03_41290 [Spirilliplanes yamanashiensis]